MGSWEALSKTCIVMGYMQRHNECFSLHFNPEVIADVQLFLGMSKGTSRAGSSS